MVRLLCDPLDLIIGIHAIYIHYLFAAPNHEFHRLVDVATERQSP